VVSGAGSGIGAATASRFAAEGASVVCIDQDGAAAGRTATDIAAGGGEALPIRADVADGASAHRANDVVLEESETASMCCLTTRASAPPGPSSM
jgi:NAD(P)-dependent dehydrogenase (short-subunit alcohol dehydrogenase family)